LKSCTIGREVHKLTSKAVLSDKLSSYQLY